MMMDTAHYMMDLNALVRDVEAALGARLRKMDEDFYQDFWVGLLQKLPESTKTDDPIPYLITSGYFFAKRQKRSAGRHQYRAYCPTCGRVWYFGREDCPSCGNKLVHDGKTSPLGDEEVKGFIPYTVDSDPTMRIAIDSFMKTLNDKDAYVAKRWLLERADLLYDNWMRQLGKEMGCTAPNIAKRARRIKLSLRDYLG